MLSALLRVVGVVCVLAALLLVRRSRFRHRPARRTRVPRHHGESTLWLERLVSAIVDAARAAAHSDAEGNDRARGSTDTSSATGDAAHRDMLAALLDLWASPPSRRRRDVADDKTIDNNDNNNNNNDDDNDDDDASVPAWPNMLVALAEERASAFLEDSGLATWAELRIASLGDRPPRMRMISVTTRPSTRNGDKRNNDDDDDDADGGGGGAHTSATRRDDDDTASARNSNKSSAPAARAAATPAAAAAATTAVPSASFVSRSMHKQLQAATTALATSTILPHDARSGSGSGGAGSDGGNEHATTTTTTATSARAWLRSMTRPLAALATHLQPRRRRRGAAASVTNTTATTTTAAAAMVSPTSALPADGTTHNNNNASSSSADDAARVAAVAARSGTMSALRHNASITSMPAMRATAAATPATTTTPARRATTTTTTSDAVSDKTAPQPPPSHATHNNNNNKSNADDGDDDAAARSIELEAELEYSGALDVRLRAELSLMRGRRLPLSVRLCDVKCLRAHVRVVATLQHARTTLDRPRRPLLHCTLWLMSDVAFDMQLHTTLSRLAIRDCFVLPLLAKYALLHYTRTRLRWPAGNGAVLRIPLPECCAAAT